MESHCGERQGSSITLTLPSKLAGLMSSHVGNTTRACRSCLMGGDAQRAHC